MSIGRDSANLLLVCLTVSYGEVGGSPPQTATAPRAEYARLQEAFERYLEIREAGGWPRVTDGPKLVLGARGERVRALRGRLEATGDLAPVESDLYDDSVRDAIQRFQRRHGLDADGIVGPLTLDELNAPVESRLQQIEANMERWSSIPQELGNRYVVVNIPAYELQVVENGAPILRMRIITGESYSPTPVLSDEITHIVLNPTWTIPESIAREEILPKVRADPGYLARQGIHVFEHSSGDEDREVDPARVDWAAIEPEDLRYTFRQDPGPANPLGKIKFVFPNRFNVYLHDTPADHHFDSDDRSLSHGCVRLEKPIDLAEYTMRADPDWSREKIVEAIIAGKTRDVELPSPLAVHLLYWTAWVEEDGSVQFRKDVYELDARPHVVPGPPTRD